MIRIAIAVQNNGQRTIAHITKNDAAQLAPLMDRNYAANGVVYFKVKHAATVVLCLTE
jgi:hypothetical protein